VEPSETQLMVEENVRIVDCTTASPEKSDPDKDERNSFKVSEDPQSGVVKNLNDLDHEKEKELDSSITTGASESLFLRARSALIHGGLKELAFLMQADNKQTR